MPTFEVVDQADPKATNKETRAISPPWVIVLAGGEGRRLSTFVDRLHPDRRPKQFATIVGTRSMLQHTYARALRLAPAENVLTIITDGQQGWAHVQLPGTSPGTLIAQPRNLDTGPAIALAVAHVMRHDPLAPVVLFPSDHFIHPEERLEGALCRALGALEDLRMNKTVLFGVRPDRVRDGLGWILPEHPPLPGGDPVEVRGFVEKPSASLARKLLSLGGLWNTFILAARASHLWYLIWKHAPAAAAPIDACCRACESTAPCEAAQTAYDQIAPFSFSAQVLANEPGELLVAPLDGLAWSDWGTPESIRETLDALGWESPPRQVAQA